MNAVQLGFIDEDGYGDAIPALRNFIRACLEKGQSAGYLPGVAANKRGYRYSPVTSWFKHPERGLLIPPNFALVGDDPGSSKFFQDPSAFDGTPPNWPSHAFMFYSSGSHLKDLGFDGQKHLVRGGAETTFSSAFVMAAETSCRGAVFENISMTGNVGGLTESFCIMTSPQEDGTLFNQVRCNGNNGSGISINGDMLKERRTPGTGLPRNIRVVDCEGNANTWQGVTVYGGRDVTIENFVGHGNGATTRWAGNGINLEWTYNTHVIGGRLTANVGGGIGGYGYNEGTRIDGDFYLDGNNTMRSWKSAEIAFASGPWWDESDGKLTGLIRDLTIVGGTIEPLRDDTGHPIYHIHIDRKETPTVSFPISGIPHTPRVNASGVKRLGRRSDWNMTPFTSPVEFSIR